MIPAVVIGVVLVLLVGLFVSTGTSSPQGPRRGRRSGWHGGGGDGGGSSCSSSSCSSSSCNSSSCSSGSSCGGGGCGSSS